MAGFLLPLRIGEASQLPALLSPYAFRHSSYPALVVLTKYITSVLEPRGLATVVATEWVEIQPVDVSSPMKNIIDAKVDVIMGTGNTCTSSKYYPLENYVIGALSDRCRDGRSLGA